MLRLREGQCLLLSSVPRGRFVPKLQGERVTNENDPAFALTVLLRAHRAPSRQTLAKCLRFNDQD